MSTPPGGPRRRRIAGERRPRPLVEPSAQPADAAPARPAAPPAAPPARPVAAGTPSDTDGEPLLQLHDAWEPAPARTSGWGSRRWLVALGSLLALLLVLAGLTALGLLGTDGVADVRETEAVEEARRVAPSTAEAAAAAILAYDHRSLEGDQQNATGFMTDEFAEEYSETFEKVVSPAAEQNRAKVTATVLASSVIRATEGSARVLLFVDQATVSRANERPQIALNRVVMTMERVGEDWLVADISSY